MPRVTKNLTVTEIRNYKPREKEQLLSDGGGLTVRIRPNGTKTFYFQYTHSNTKRKVKLQIGPFPEISLLEARKLALSYKELLARGTDPREHLLEQKDSKKLAETSLLRQTAEEWFEVKRCNVSNNYAEDIWRSLELHVFPKLGTLPISNITAPKVIQVLRTVEAKGSLETIKRLSQRLNEIMTYAVNTGKINANPIQSIQAAFKKPKPQRMKSIPPSELPRLMRDISIASIKRTTRCLIEFQLHTITRPGEASNAMWSEIDWDNQLWVLPANKMKMGRTHIIPLSNYCIKILHILKEMNSCNPYVFGSPLNSRRPLNSQTVNAALKRMGYQGKLVSHGFRSLASTILNENGFDSDLIEVALAHVDKNQVRNAYNRANYLKQRRIMMDWWSMYLIRSTETTCGMCDFEINP